MICHLQSDISFCIIVVSWLLHAMYWCKCVHSSNRSEYDERIAVNHPVAARLQSILFCGIGNNGHYQVALSSDMSDGLF